MAKESLQNPATPAQIPNGWKDFTGRSVGEPASVVRSVGTVVGSMKVSVTRWIHGEANVWYLNCDDLWLKYEPLKATDLEGATLEAVKRVTRVVRKNLFELIDLGASMVSDKKLRSTESVMKSLGKLHRKFRAKKAGKTKGK